MMTRLARMRRGVAATYRGDEHIEFAGCILGCKDMYILCTQGCILRIHLQLGAGRLFLARAV